MGLGSGRSRKSRWARHQFRSSCSSSKISPSSEVRTAATAMPAALVMQSMLSLVEKQRWSTQPFFRSNVREALATVGVLLAIGMSSLTAWPSLSEVIALGRGEESQCLPFRSLEMTTNCPQEDDWVAHLLAHDTRPVDPNTVFLDVGCNTGADAVKYLDLWGRSPGIFQAWHEGLKGEGAIRAGSCQNNQSTWPQRTASSSINPTVICVEPMSANVEVMRGLHHRVLNSSSAFEIVHAAVSDHVGVAAFPSGQVGTEDFGLDVASPVDPAGNARQIQTVEVNVTSADRHGLEFFSSITWRFMVRIAILGHLRGF